MDTRRAADRGTSDAAISADSVGNAVSTSSRDGTSSILPLTTATPAASVQLSLPVGGDAVGGTGHRLVVGVRLGRGERRPVRVLLGLVVPEPVLTRLEAPDDGMAGRACVAGSVLRRRAVAAADVTALCTSAQVQPPTGRVRPLTVGATSSARRHRRV